ncbi:hypothetical protein [Kribbella catacumbae]|uniref:hypothetical protein n=1 Tax=Kribbella catacumbae TaxID=460086 RepID=UPI0003704C30|nr:hypothetical protein [Kribbella catacumbae]
MSYPPPSGPQDPRPQDLPSWQQQPYQPQGGNWAAPPYGGPPRKNRAGLIIALIVVLVLAILGIGGFVTYTLASGENDGGTAPGASPSGAPINTPTRNASPPAPPKTSAPTKPVPSKAVPTKVVPTKAVPSRPTGTTKADAVALAGLFVGHLNADNTEAAIALSCSEVKSLIPTLISALIKAPTKLTIDGAAIGQNPYLVQISGTTKGQTMSGQVIIQDACIRVFHLTPN